MPITFLNAAMLAGLAAIALPPLIHLLTRRKFDTVAWARDAVSRSRQPNPPAGRSSTNCCSWPCAWD